MKLATFSKVAEFIVAVCVEIKNYAEYWFNVISQISSCAGIE